MLQRQIFIFTVLSWPRGVGMALAGIESRIPPDEVIDAMRSIGRRMDSFIRETGEGGLAATPTGVRVKEALKEQQT